MILVTGGAGYIGSHTVINLLNDHQEIVIFDSLERGHLETIQTLKSIGNVEFVQGDLKNIQDIESVFQNYKIDAVIHFAAFIVVSESVEEPSKYYRNNTLGTLNLLDTMIKYNVKKIVFSSTCAVYGNPNYVPLDEVHAKNPISPYGASKLMVERMMKDYEIAYDLKSIIFRYFNVIGCDSQLRVGECHEPKTHLLANILQSIFESNKTFKIFGNDYNTKDGTCIRDYVNVEDLAQAHRLALHYLNKENQSNIFNLGTENGTSVKEIFEICESVLNKKINVEIVERREGDAEILYANSQKAKEILGWNPTRTIEDSIKTAYQWEMKMRNCSNNISL